MPSDLFYGGNFLTKEPENLDFEIGLMAHGHYLAKVPKNKACWYSIDRKFHADG
jgi:hypothetical protein